MNNGRRKLDHLHDMFANNRLMPFLDTIDESFLKQLINELQRDIKNFSEQDVTIMELLYIAQEAKKHPIKPPENSKKTLFY